MHYPNVFLLRNCEISLVHYHPGIVHMLLASKQATSFTFLASKIILVSLLPTP